MIGQPQDAVDTVGAPAPVSYDRWVTLAIALSIFTGPLSLAVWVPLAVVARREGRTVLLRWSIGMTVVMLLFVMATVGLHVIFGTHAVVVTGPAT